MSSNQDFPIKINDIFDKIWSVRFDDSDGYTLFIEPIDQKNSSPVLPETEQEETTTVIENNSSNIVSSGNSENELHHHANRESIIESRDESNGIKRELCLEFKINLRTIENCQHFIEEINNSNLINSEILPIRYEELLGKLLSDKMINLIEQFREREQLKQLKQVYKKFKEFNNF